MSDACTVTVNGAGALGAAMAARLAETGHQVRLWNRTPAKARPGRTTPTSIHLMH